jgi:hypothetical protein
MIHEDAALRRPDSTTAVGAAKLVARRTRYRIICGQVPTVSLADASGKFFAHT